MTVTNVEVVDIEGAVLAYLRSYPGLTGPTDPLSGGVHMSAPKIPSTGAIGHLGSVVQRRVDDIVDTCVLTFTVQATGGEQRAREVAEAGARALAMACRALTGAQVVVQTRRGDWVRLLIAGDSTGPTFTGEAGGQAVYSLTCTFLAQPATAP